MTFKIAIIGPESTGKSELTKALSGRFRVPSVDEFARTYLENLGRDYIQDDLFEIARGQISLEEKALANNPEFLICDTNLLVIKIWSEYKYGNCDARIIDLMNSRSYDLFLLTKPDIPWTHDPLRENPDNSDELFQIHLEEIIKDGTKHRIVSGQGEERLKIALQALNELGIGSV